MPPSNSRRINGSVSTVSSFASRDQYSRQASAEVQISPDFSEPSIQSRSTNGSGPSMKQPALITSSWGIGWQTPALMLGPYVFAILIAVAHFSIFQYLDGRDADGPDAAISQSYITTASNILANIYGFSLRAALAVAFAQYLWRLLRIETMKVSTIELLFNIRTNLFVLLRPTALKATPFLFALAVLMWASQVVISFPPGALTVRAAQRITEATRVIPTFNASFMGNGSGVDANRYSLISLELDPPVGFVVGDFNNVNNTNLINRVARQVLNSGETFPMVSPCGVNCSYIMEFEGPWIECNTTTSTKFLENVDFQDLLPIYSGWWTTQPEARLSHSSYNGTYTQATYNSTILFPLVADRGVFNGSANSSLSVRQDNITCFPGRAIFTINNTYTNNIQNRSVTAKPIDTLINLAPITHNGAIKVPGFNAAKGFAYGTEPAEWSSYALDYYRDNNLMTIFAAMFSWLNGEFLAGPSFNPQTTPADLESINELFWKEQIVTSTTGSTIRYSATNGTIIDSTRFNTAFGSYHATEPAHPAFNMSQNIMNDYLLNMTLSMMTAYGTWNTTTSTTTSTLHNVYEFSQPLNLLLPYFITLAFALPFIIVGGLALIWNGVAATDGSFMQIVSTTTGSAVLDRAAAGGCLGGEESVPTELKDLKVRFGEIVGREGEVVRRAGFGVESEVGPLRKSEKYGIARWI